jgi:hypothetical protein
MTYVPKALCAINPKTVQNTDKIASKNGVASRGLRNVPPQGTDPGWVSLMSEAPQNGGSLFSRVSALHVSQNSISAPRWLSIATGISNSKGLRTVAGAR